MEMLKFTLPGAVTDESLTRLGEVGLHVKLANNLTIRFRNTSVVNWRAVGSDDVGFVTQQGTVIAHQVSSGASPSSDNTIIFSDGEYDVFFTRAGITRIYLALPDGDYGNVIGGWFAGITATDITFSNTLFFNRQAKFTDISEGGVENLIIRNDNEVPTLSDDISYFEGKNPRTLTIRKQNITGNISSFAGCTNLQTLNLPFCDGLEGSIESLSTLVNLSTLLLTSPVTGSIENFANALWAAGKTSGSISITITQGSVTYNGNVISTAAHTLTFSSDPNVKWTWN